LFGGTKPDKASSYLVATRLVVLGLGFEVWVWGVTCHRKAMPLTCHW